MSQGVGLAEAAAQVGVGRSTGWRWRQPVPSVPSVSVPSVPVSPVSVPSVSVPSVSVSPGRVGSGGSERQRRVAGVVGASWAARVELVSGLQALQALHAQAQELDELAERGRYLTLPEREIIALGRMLGLGVRVIARMLGRAPSTVSRELSRNTYVRIGSSGAVQPSSRRYGPLRAERAARQRRRRPKVRKLAADEVLWEHVKQCLGKKWSPRQIAETPDRGDTA